MVNKKEQVCIMFHHCSFPNKEVHAVEWWVKVLEEGAAEHFFGDEAGGAPQEQGKEIGQQAIPTQVFNAGSHAEGIGMVQNIGFLVDDNNKPAPEIYQHQQLHTQQHQHQQLIMGRTGDGRV
eukprot:10187066-Ditylum_brightwellii.AAC.2